MASGNNHFDDLDLDLDVPDRGNTPSTHSGGVRKDRSGHHQQPASPSSKQQLQKRPSGRQKTKWEIIQSLEGVQKTFVEKLDTLIKAFVRPISDNNTVSKYRQLLYSNIKEVYSIHVKIQSDLEFGSKQNLDNMLKTLISNCDSLQAHVEYEHQLPAALRKLEELKHSEPDVYKKIAGGETPQMRLRDLISCVPEVLQTYLSHLEEFQHASDRAVDDKPKIDEALTVLYDMEQYIEVCKQDLDIRAYLTKLQHQITSVNWRKTTLSKDFGRLVLEGAFKFRKASSTAQQEKLRHIILMDKMILVTTTTKKDHYGLENVIDLSKHGVAGDSKLLQFRVEQQDGNALVLTASNKQQYGVWQEAISQAWERLHPKNGVDGEYSFSLHTFSTLQRCDKCRLTLKGLYSQGYFCPRTRKQSHLECIHGCKKIGPAPKSRPMENINLVLPISTSDKKDEKLCFGGYIGRKGGTDPPNIVVSNYEMRELLLKALANKLKLLKAGVLKGGFKYVDLRLKVTNPTVPIPFLVWESKIKGMQEQAVPKPGFLEHLYNALTENTEEITESDVEEVARAHNGQVNSYMDTITGETIIAGYYEEIDEVLSSDEDEISSPFHAYGFSIPNVHLDQTEDIKSSQRSKKLSKDMQRHSFHHNPGSKTQQGSTTTLSGGQRQRARSNSADKGVPIAKSGLSAKPLLASRLSAENAAHGRRGSIESSHGRQFTRSNQHSNTSVTSKGNHKWK